MKYKYQLRSGSKKEICPQCGQRRFVPYVLASDGVTMAGAEYGRCDREENCGYIKYPTEESKSVDAVEVKPQPKKEPIRFAKDVLVVSPYGNLYKYAERVLKWKALAVWQMYKVTTYQSFTMFWQIDINGKIHAGKGIAYGTDGHRIKDDRPCVWAHKIGAYKNLMQGEELQQCFFGEHLLTNRPKAKVHVVESEKTAMLMSAVAPDFVWLACGGSKGLGDDKCKVLEGREVKLFPDNGQLFSWGKIARKHGWEIDTTIEDCPVVGCDVWDVTEEIIKNERRMV